MSRNPDFDKDDPAGELAPCGFGAFGTCCCTCVNLAKTLDKCNHLGGSRTCGTEETAGFACLGFYRADGGPIMLNWEEHGMCEMYQAKKDSSGKPS